MAGKLCLIHVGTVKASHRFVLQDVKFVVTAGAEDRADTEKVVQRCQVGVEMTITNLKGHKGDETVT